MRFLLGLALALAALAWLMGPGSEWLLSIDPVLVLGGFSVACYVAAGWLAWQVRP